MKKILFAAAMLLIAGTAAYADVTPKKVDCDVHGKTTMVANAAACTALGGSVVPAKKVS